MNWKKPRLPLLLLFFVLALGLIMGISIADSGKQIAVDVGQVVTLVEHNLGIGLNFLSDRPDVSQSLQKLQVGTLRYATNESYLFDGQEPNSPKVAIQDSSLWQVDSFAKADGTWWSKLDFDQFMKICQETQAEPFIVVAIDAIAYQGTAPHATAEEVIAAAADWVKYANLERGYQIKYWEIGNESNIKHHEEVVWTPEQYAQTVVQIAQAMKAVDPTIKIGANGMRVKENDDWWSRIMPIVKDDVDFLITHQYSWESDYLTWKDTTSTYDYNLQDAVKAIATYNPQLKLNVTENSSFNPSVSHSNNTWKMLHNFEMLGQALSTKQVDYIHFWTSRWLESDPLAEDNSAFDTNYQLTPMGYPLQVWNQFLKSSLVYSAQIPTVSSWASYEPKDRSLSILLLNKEETPQNVSIVLNNYIPKTRLLKPWVLQGATPESIDVTWSQSGSAWIWDRKIRVELEPLSVTAIALEGK
ncbi:MAG: hypothetical protein AAFQ14_09120 [Cyanobacteria bacterium J06621_12]